MFLICLRKNSRDFDVCFRPYSFNEVLWLINHEYLKTDRVLDNYHLRMAHRKFVVLGYQYVLRHGSLKPPVLQTTQGLNVELSHYVDLLCLCPISLHHYRSDASLLHLGGLQTGQQGKIKETFEALSDRIYA